MPEHVKIPAVPPRIQYVADGSQRSFTYPFPIFDKTDLQVFLNEAPQTTGFGVDGTNIAAGGRVIFDLAPPEGARVTLRRRLTVERVTDFLESGPFAARALNDEFDYLTACMQQLADDQGRMLRYTETDAPSSPLLPGRAARANQLLAFDADGNPTVVPTVDTEALGSYVPPDPGAVRRTIRDKLREMVSVRDFGAVGDGVADDTLAFQAALAAASSVFVPIGRYRISRPIVLGYGQTLFGGGEGSVIQARAEPFDGSALPAYSTGFNAIEMVQGYATVRDLRVVGGATGIKLYGRDGPCVKNVVENVSIWDAVIGLVLDGHDSPDRPCYWNNISRVLCARPQLHGVLLTVGGAGDTPNANKFHDVRVYSLGSPTSGCGFFLSAGRFNNSFVDCEANIDPGGQACFRLGALTDQTLIVNFYAESLGALPGIRIDNGSLATSIVNLFSATGGAPIWDTADGRNYTAFNAGFPTSNYLKKTWITDLKLQALQYDTEYVEPPAGGLVEPDLASTTYFVSAYGGPVEFRLPAAGPSNGRVVTVKKVDLSANPVTITEAGAAGPDGRAVALANRYDFISAVSNGASWFITGGNAMPSNTRFHEAPGLFEPDMGQSLYTVSAYGGAVEVRLPPPGAAHAVGRSVTVKKTDPSANPVTVTQSGGGGPDNEPIPLSAQGAALTVMSNGSAWHILARYS